MGWIRESWLLCRMNVTGESGGVKVEWVGDGWAEILLRLWDKAFISLGDFLWCNRKEERIREERGEEKAIERKQRWLSSHLFHFICAPSLKNWWLRFHTNFICVLVKNRLPWNFKLDGFRMNNNLFFPPERRTERLWKKSQRRGIKCHGDLKKTANIHTRIICLQKVSGELEWGNW